MRKAFGWKLLLPMFQSLLAIGLWLYAPVQYRKELLDLTHRPADHPFRFRFEGARRVFPPTCEQFLYVINFPAFSVSRGIVDPIIRRIEYSRQAMLLPEWTFSIPVSDPEALPPRRILYFVHGEDLIFLGLIILLWNWVGWRIDELAAWRTGVSTRSRLWSLVELTTVAATLLLCLAFACRVIIEADSPHLRRIGMFGLIWPAVLLVYIWLVARPALRGR